MASKTTRPAGAAGLAGLPLEIDLVNAQDEVIDTQKVALAEDGFIDAKMICVGTAEGGQGSCNGDSGGPATVNVGGTQRQVGLVSFGKKGCRGPNAYSVFTRVASHAEWIRSATGGAVDWR